MAVEYQLDDEDEEKQTSGAPQDISGAPVVVAGANQPSDAPGTSSGSYTNLQKYIEANKGRDFGGQVAGKIDSGTQEGLKQLGERESAFKSDVDKNTISFDDDLRGKITNSPESLSDEDKAKALNVRTGTYKGPTDFGGGADAESDPYGALRKYFGGLEDKSKALASTSGVKPILNEMYGRPTYTEGEKNLDAFILGGQKAPVDAARTNLTNAINQYGQKKTELGNYATSAKDKGSAALAEYQKLLGLDAGGSASPYERGQEATGLIQKQLQGLYAKEDAKKAEQKKFMENPYGYTVKDAAGDDYTIENNPYGVDPSRYFKDVADVNYQRTASPQDLARLQALTELAGIDQNYLDPNVVGTQDDEPLYGFDKEGYVTAILDQSRRKRIGNGGGIGSNTGTFNWF